MQWLNKVCDEIVAAHPEGELIVSSGVSPSGKYHIGTLREVLTADAMLLGLRKRGRQIKHIHFADDLDGLRKVPAGVPKEFEKYLGIPVCDVPSPDKKAKSYADYYLSDFVDNIDHLGIDMEVVRSHEKYRDGWFVPSIETALDKSDQAKEILETVSGHKLGDTYSPIQVNEGGYLKKRPFVSIDKANKTLRYIDKDGQEQSIAYDKGDVKLDWRLDWPARWAQLGVDVEPFGRDHASKGGSYDTGAELVQKIFTAKPPVPVPYEFINRAGDTKKMSKSAGNTVTVSELLEVLPPEIIRYFVLRYAPNKMLYFDQAEGVVRLIDEYAELLAKPDKSEEENLTLEIAQGPIGQTTVSNIPFSHLVASYQAADRNPNRALKVIERTEYADVAKAQAETITKELAYIDKWLDSWAPDNLKFAIAETVSADEFSPADKAVLQNLANKVSQAPAEADGEWFHKAIYGVKEENQLQPTDIFKPLYKALIDQESGPRAGHFMADLLADRGKDWLVDRLLLSR